MSGARRLAVFLSIAWLVAVYVMYAMDEVVVPGWKMGYFLFAVCPVGLAWGVWWVWRGFRPLNSPPTRTEM